MRYVSCWVQLSKRSTNTTLEKKPAKSLSNSLEAFFHALNNNKELHELSTTIFQMRETNYSNLWSKICSSPCIVHQRFFIFIITQDDFGLLGWICCRHSSYNCLMFVCPKVMAIIWELSSIRELRTREIALRENEDRIRISKRRSSGCLTKSVLCIRRELCYAIFLSERLWMPPTLL